ncbi:hypothetical protein P7K49_003397 [Saguinus oedipus]|uniref:Uncharacterized protein n=1 Tax=Saguinus oedipus TaxID=9490 RepID=A0ABQ9W564_SAGOE|nr:hypothetical protein P7K49_003397 [Saguinus oedipus]
MSNYTISNYIMSNNTVSNFPTSNYTISNDNMRNYTVSNNSNCTVSNDMVSNYTRAAGKFPTSQKTVRTFCVEGMWSEGTNLWVVEWAECQKRLLQVLGSMDTTSHSARFLPAGQSLICSGALCAAWCRPHASSRRGQQGYMVTQLPLA